MRENYQNCTQIHDLDFFYLDRDHLKETTRVTFIALFVIQKNTMSGPILKMFYKSKLFVTITVKNSS